MSNNEQIQPVNLEQLQREEEALRRATEEAQNDLQQGKTTEAVFEDLRTRYYAAKQARENFEAKS